MIRMTKALHGGEIPLSKIGSFMGFDDSSDSDSDDHPDVELGTTANHCNSDPKVILQSTLLKGLPNWLDRLFEGTTHRYYINYWPDFPTK